MKSGCGVQFYRQKPLGNYIVDFYAPKAKLVVEVDGGQHFRATDQKRDRKRDQFLNSQGLEVLRFSSRAVFEEMEGVLEKILQRTQENRFADKSPLPPFFKGGYLNA